MFGGMELGGDEAQGCGLAGSDLACDHTDGPQVYGIKTAFGRGFKPGNGIELADGDILCEGLFGEGEMIFIIRHGLSPDRRACPRCNGFSHQDGQVRTLRALFPLPSGRGGFWR